MAYTDPTRVMRTCPDAQPQDGGVDPALILVSIEAAQAEVDGYLAGVYALPLTTEVPLLTRIATDIAIMNILTARPFIPPPRTVETPWPVRYNAAVALLVKIQSGEIALVGVDGAPVARSGAGVAWSSTQNYVPTFGEGNDRTFRVDPDKVDAEASRRW